MYIYPINSTPFPITLRMTSPGTPPLEGIRVLEFAGIAPGYVLPSLSLQPYTIPRDPLLIPTALLPASSSPITVPPFCVSTAPPTLQPTPTSSPGINPPSVSTLNRLPQSNSSITSSRSEKSISSLTPSALVSSKSSTLARRCASS